MSERPKRVSVYIDGFNLFFGLRDSGFRKYYWLDINKLATSFLRDGQVLVEVKYFTARIKGDKEKQLRQKTYLEAVALTERVTIFEGQYLEKNQSCRRCRSTWKSHEEKMTDVNIATEMLTDGFANRYDRAVLVSGDSDLVPPIAALVAPPFDREIVVAFPPKRQSHALKQAATTHFHINPSALAASQLADEIAKPDGYVLRRPDEWR